MRCTKHRQSSDVFRVSFIALLACAMTGCASPQEIQQVNQQRCISYGFHQATNDFAQCMQRESLAMRYLGGEPIPHYTYSWW